MNTMYIFWAVVGAIVAIIIIFVASLFGKSHRRAGKKIILDERQEHARGKGYQYGFFTLLILSVVVAFLVPFFDIIAANITIVILGVIIISVSVFAIYCIVNDAYIGLNENPRQIMGVLTSLGLLNAVPAVPAILHGTSFILNGEIASWVMNLSCAVMLFIIDGVYYFHQNKISKDEE